MTSAGTRRRVESMTRDGLTIGQVMAEVARMGDPVGRAEVREIMAETRRHRAMQGHARRKRGEEVFTRNYDRRRVVVRDDGETWPNMSEAARAHGVHPRSMQRACHTGRTCCGHGFRLKED